MSILQNLTEGIVNRDLSKEGEAILNKWEKTGLLEGLDNDFNKNQMAVLLENQAKELLREANTMAGGDVEGFAAVAFPIVRRVFGGLLAQKLVSVQPMSLPSGLIFFMDFVKQGPNTDGAYVSADLRDGLHVSNDDGTAGAPGGGTLSNPSVYGGQVVAQGLLNGAQLDPEARGDGAQTPQFQDLIQGHSFARGATPDAALVVAAAAINLATVGGISDAQAKLIQFDPDLIARTAGHVVIARRPITALDGLGAAGTHPLNTPANSFARCVKPDVRHIVAVQPDGTSVTGLGNVDATTVQVRRLTRIVTGDGDTSLLTGTDMNVAGTDYLEVVFFDATGANASMDAANDTIACGLEFAMADNIGNATAPSGAGAIVGAQAWEMEGSANLPEIAIKVDSTAITAVTRKLKASWSPELAQDLNAYHNLDAEVELTGILSEQIALEIDQEILADLIAGASASKLYWSRRPGLFVNRLTGADATSLASPPDFTGSVSEWYETLVETINDVSADIHRKTLRGGANFLVCGPEVANILEFTSGFRASVTHDDATGSVGAVQVGSINKKWDLHVDPYFPRNVILVGRKGGSFLESGYVYAPYVPLQVTPTIFDADDFTPRKAVMTRYGKKLVRPDMYGLVICRDLEG